jgi:hypothetical protein
MLHMTQGSRFAVLARADENWYEVQDAQGNIGLVPVSYCQPI